MTTGTKRITRTRESPLGAPAFAHILRLASIALAVICTAIASGACPAGAQPRYVYVYDYDPASTPTTSLANVAVATASGDSMSPSVSRAAGVVFRSFVAAEDGFAPIAGGSQLKDFAASGREIDPNGGGQLTRAGRGYAKASEVFGPTSGGPAEINTAGQTALEEILGNPGTTETIRQAGRFAGGSQFVSPDGIGAVFDPDGNFQFFGRMAP